MPNQLSPPLSFFPLSLPARLRLFYAPLNMEQNTNRQLILASASARRSKILAGLGLSFSVVSPDVEEIVHLNNPEKTVIENSMLKNEWCRQRFPDCFIISADTIVEFGGRIVTKPESRAEAFEFLRMLSGQIHRVYTGVAFAKPLTPASARVDISHVKFRQLGDQMINEYIERVNPMDRAGAYDIDESGDMLVESFTGSRTNIMGLASETVRELLKPEGLL